MRRLAVLAAIPVLFSSQVSDATFGDDNCYTNSQYGNSAYFDAQYTDKSCSGATAPSPVSTDGNTNIFKIGLWR